METIDCIVFNLLHKRIREKNKNVCLKYTHIYIFYLYMHKYIHKRIRRDTHDTVFMAITGHMVTADIL